MLTRYASPPRNVLFSPITTREMPYRRQAPVPLGLACRLVLKLGIHGLWGDEDEGRAYTCRMERASYTWYCPCMRWQATGPNWRGPTSHPDLLSAWLLADTPML